MSKSSTSLTISTLRNENPYLPAVLTDDAKREVIRIFGQMLVSFSPSVDQAVLKVYAGVVGEEGFPVEVIAETARRFSVGGVSGHNHRFPPTTAEFCEEARAVWIEHRGRLSQNYSPNVAAYLANAATFRSDPEVSEGWYKKAMKAIAEEYQ